MPEPADPKVDCFELSTRAVGLESTLGCVDDHGELSADEKASAALLELLEQLERRHPETMHQEAARRGLPGLAFDLLVERADSDDPVVREEARALMAEHGFSFLLPDEESDIPDD